MCFSDIVYGIIYMYITKYGCVFLKLGESIYVAMDLIPILLGSLPLAHNAQHSLVIMMLKQVSSLQYKVIHYILQVCILIQLLSIIIYSTFTLYYML